MCWRPGIPLVRLAAPMLNQSSAVTSECDSGVLIVPVGLKDALWDVKDPNCTETSIFEKTECMNWGIRQVPAVSSVLG